MKCLKITPFVAIIVLFFINCSNDDEVASTNNVIPTDNFEKGIKIPSAIYRDTTFINYIEATYNDSKLLKDVTTLESYILDDDLSNSELSNIHTILGYNTAKELTDYLEIQRTRENYLSSTYNFHLLNNTQKLQIFDTGFEMNIPEYYGKVNPCKTRVHAEAVLLHLACVAGDFTVVVGLICHSAVTVWHSSALQECK